MSDKKFNKLINSLSLGQLLVAGLYIFLFSIIYTVGFLFGVYRLYIGFPLMYAILWMIVWAVVSWYLFMFTIDANYESYIAPKLKAFDAKNKAHKKSK